MFSLISKNWRMIAVVKPQQQPMCATIGNIEAPEHTRRDNKGMFT